MARPDASVSSCFVLAYISPKPAGAGVGLDMRAEQATEALSEMGISMFGRG